MKKGECIADARDPMQTPFLYARHINAQDGSMERKKIGHFEIKSTTARNNLLPTVLLGCLRVAGERRQRCNVLCLIILAIPICQLATCEKCRLVVTTQLAHAKAPGNKHCVN